MLRYLFVCTCGDFLFELVCVCMCVSVSVSVYVYVYMIREILEKEINGPQGDCVFDGLSLTGVPYILVT